jgi:hypothetical protein
LYESLPVVDLDPNPTDLAAFAINYAASVILPCQDLQEIHNTTGSSYESLHAASMRYEYPPLFNMNKGSKRSAGK